MKLQQLKYSVISILNSNIPRYFLDFAVSPYSHQSENFIPE